MKSKKIRCDIYTRVSTTMQVDGYSLDVQKEKLKRYAEFQNMEGPSAQPYTYTPIEHRASIFGLHQRCKQGEHRGKHNQAERGTQEIKCSFHRYH